jgi:hypothetical protein
MISDIVQIAQRRVCVLQNDFELEIFALVTGCISVLAVVILAVVVIHLNSSIKK